jgi:hypothetical protein
MGKDWFVKSLFDFSVHISKVAAADARIGADDYCLVKFKLFHGFSVFL